MSNFFSFKDNSECTHTQTRKGIGYDFFSKICFEKNKKKVNSRLFFIDKKSYGKFKKKHKLFPKLKKNVGKK